MTRIIQSDHGMFNDQIRDREALQKFNVNHSTVNHKELIQFNDSLSIGLFKEYSLTTLTKKLVDILRRFSVDKLLLAFIGKSFVWNRYCDFVQYPLDIDLVLRWRSSFSG